MQPPDALNEKILEGIREVVRSHLQVQDPVELDTPLVEAWRLDSLRMLTLVAELENRFQVIFADGDEQGLDTVADLVALLRARGAS